MMDWTQDNFLERLAPRLRQKSGEAIGHCPDAETLMAVIEAEPRQPELNTVIHHLSQCGMCADLRARLLNFESESPPVLEAEWNQTRIRLENWLEGFLRSGAARSWPAKRYKPSWRVSGMESFWNFATSMKVVWALGAALALVVFVDGILFLKYRRDHLPPGQVAVRPTISPNPPVTIPGVPTTTPREEGLPKAGNSLPSEAELRNGLGAGSPAVPSIPPGQNFPSASAQATAPSPPNPGPGEVAPPKQPSLPPNAGSEAPTTHSNTLQLDPASRLFIVLSSIGRKPEGGFQFRGTLLLPVVHRGAVQLDRGAEIIGTGSISQGQTTLAVTDVVIQGARYTLKDGNGVMHAETPGAGGGVDLHRSQVLDMHPTAAAVYEQVVDPAGRAEPQK